MKHWSLHHLDIIGFASILESPTLPRVVAPVFRDRDKPDCVLLPPFSLIGDEVFNVGESSLAEFESLIAGEKVTRLESPIAGATLHELWVNDRGEVKYTLKAEMQTAFERIFQDRMRLAEEALANRDFAVASQHAVIARAAQPSSVDPLVIRAAAEKLSGDLSRFAFTKDIVRRLLSPADFDRLVALKCGEDASESPTARVAMAKAALRKPTPVLA